MSNKKILVIFSNARVAEKLFGVIPELAKLYKLDLYAIGEFSPKTRWWGDVDNRAHFLENNKQYFDKIIEGNGLLFHGDKVKNILDPLNLDEYDVILYDDNGGGSTMPLLYHEAKKKNILVIGNHHGNAEFFMKDTQNAMGGEDKELKGDKTRTALLGGLREEHEVIGVGPGGKIAEGLGRTIDKSFIFGEKERLIYSQVFDENRLIKGGIPSNDTLKKYIGVEGEYILVITNFLGNHLQGKSWLFTNEEDCETEFARNCLFPVNFDKDFLHKSGLLELSKKYNKRIVIKQKTRFDDPNYKKNIKYIKERVMKGNECEIITDTNNIDEVIAKSFIVLSSASTLSFKPIQLGIPTVIIEGSGQIGNFYDYSGLVPFDKNIIAENFEKQIKEGIDKEFIETTIEGGSDFNSTGIYINNLKKVIDEHKSNL
tara:strand:+ start:152 stop:1435 length:1284 start_codon:yes stop_codon:yes gene_type:complete